MSPVETAAGLLTGESVRTLDDRYRLSLPAELAEAVGGPQAECLLTKERPGCLALWRRDVWAPRHELLMEVFRSKLAGGRLETRLGDVQRLGRLLSTRQRVAPLAGRGRLAIPEGFREVLGVEPGGDVVVVGAAICVELWRPDAWAEHLAAEMPAYRELADALTS